MNDAGTHPESTVILGSDFDLGTERVTIVCSPSFYMTFDLNGHYVTGAGTYTIDVNSGNVTLKDSACEAALEQGYAQKPENGVFNTSTAGYAINSGEGLPVVTIRSGLYEANASAVCAWQGTVRVPVNAKYPFIYSKNGDPVMINKGSPAKPDADVLLYNGIYNKIPEGVAKVAGEQAYEAYYNKAMHYYVVMEKHPIYLRGTGSGDYKADKGFDTLEYLTEEIAARVSKGIKDHTVFLMENYAVGKTFVDKNGNNATEPTDVTLAEGCNVTLDLYGCQLTGLDGLHVPYHPGDDSHSTLTITDSLIGGFIAIPNDVTTIKVEQQDDPEHQGEKILVVTDSNITITGGTYDTTRPGVLRQILGKGPQGETIYNLQENVYKGHTYYTVVRATDKILVPGKGSAETFDEALAIAEDGDTLMLIGDFDGDSILKQEVDFLDQNLNIDLNGHIVSCNKNYTFVLYGSTLSIKGEGTLKNKCSSYNTNVIYLQELNGKRKESGLVLDSVTVINESPVGGDVYIH